MIGQFAPLIGLVALSVALLVGAVPAQAQDPPVTCASTVWLEPAAANAADGSVPAATAGPAWMTIELIDACSGQPFTLADFSGKVLYVEMMATWCPPCREQLIRVKEAATRIPDDDRGEIVFIALSSEFDLPSESLAAYAATNDFPFIFAVMPVEMIRAMAEDLGQEVAVPPATPHVIIAADGTIGEVQTGSASPDEILALLAEAAPGEEAAGS